MTLIADVFTELVAPKNVVRSMSKKLCFTGLETEDGKWFETLLPFQ